MEIVYNTNTKTLKIYKDTQKKPAKTVKVTVRASGPSTIELSNSKHGIRQILKLDNRGSDGASDKVYPYSATWSQKDSTLRPIGGCSTR
jgi:hypothetical protein